MDREQHNKPLVCADEKVQIMQISQNVIAGFGLIFGTLDLLAADPEAATHVGLLSAIGYMTCLKYKNYVQKN